MHRSPITITTTTTTTTTNVFSLFLTRYLMTRSRLAASAVKH
ncbi:hypothetical protein [uncultured Thiodictyon sp.]|nr:hypothetical protein [uncultured Thiodictyon sp.]